jgi:hypothetical protein
MRSVRIVSDGTPKGTHIYDAATGDKLEGIQSVKLELAVGGGNRMRATLTEKARVDEVLVTEADAEERQGEAAPAADFFSWPWSSTAPSAGGATYTVNTCCNGSH